MNESASATHHAGARIELLQIEKGRDDGPVRTALEAGRQRRAAKVDWSARRSVNQALDELVLWRARDRGGRNQDADRRENWRGNHRSRRDSEESV